VASREPGGGRPPRPSPVEAMPCSLTSWGRGDREASPAGAGATVGLPVVHVVHVVHVPPGAHGMWWPATFSRPPHREGGNASTRSPSVSLRSTRYGLSGGGLGVKERRLRSQRNPGAPGIGLRGRWRRWVVLQFDGFAFFRQPAKTTAIAVTPATAPTSRPRRGKAICGCLRGRLGRTNTQACADSRTDLSPW
jgi:hypothetical protein